MRAKLLGALVVLALAGCADHPAEPWNAEDAEVQFDDTVAFDDIAATETGEIKPEWVDYRWEVHFHPLDIEQLAALNSALQDDPMHSAMSLAGITVPIRKTHVCHVFFPIPSKINGPATLILGHEVEHCLYWTYHGKPDAQWDDPEFADNLLKRLIEVTGGRL
jgi:hypothetical protein